MFELLVLLASLLVNVGFLVYQFYPDTKARAVLAADAKAVVTEVEQAVDSHVQSPTTV